MHRFFSARIENICGFLQTVTSESEEMIKAENVINQTISVGTSLATCLENTIHQFGTYSVINVFTSVSLNMSTFYGVIIVFLNFLKF